MIESTVRVGDTLPAFTLRDEAGEEVSLPIDEPTVLLFFRGHW